MDEEREGRGRRGGGGEEEGRRRRVGGLAKVLNVREEKGEKEQR